MYRYSSSVYSYHTSVWFWLQFLRLYTYFFHSDKTWKSVVIMIFKENIFNFMPLLRTWKFYLTDKRLNHFKNEINVYTY